MSAFVWMGIDDHRDLKRVSDFLELKLLVVVNLLM